MQSQQQASRPPREVISLPEDEEAKLSLLFYSASLVMHQKFTSTVYELEVKNQQINSLTRIPRDVQKANVDYAAMLRRLIGPITQFNITTTTKTTKNYFLAAIVLLSTMGIAGYIYISPELRTGMIIWWQQYGSYFAVGLLIFLSIVLLWFYTRRRSRRNRPA